MSTIRNIRQQASASVSPYLMSDCTHVCVCVWGGGVVVAQETNTRDNVTEM